MRHKVKRGKLGCSSAHRKSILRNLSLSLARYCRVKTTLARARALRPFVEPLITKAVRAYRSQDSLEQLHTLRLIAKKLGHWGTAHNFLIVWGHHFAERPGGYTRIIKLGPRMSDSAEMALIEMVGRPSFLEPNVDVVETESYDLGQHSKRLNEIFRATSVQATPRRIDDVAHLPVPLLHIQRGSVIKRGLILEVEIPSGTLESWGESSPKQKMRKTAPLSLYLSLDGKYHRLSRLDGLPNHVYIRGPKCLQVDFYSEYSQRRFNIVIETLVEDTKIPPATVRILRENGATVQKLEFPTR